MTPPGRYNPRRNGYFFPASTVLVFISADEVWVRLECNNFHFEAGCSGWFVVVGCVMLLYLSAMIGGRVLVFSVDLCTVCKPGMVFFWIV